MNPTAWVHTDRVSQINCEAPDAAVPTPGLASEEVELHMDVGSRGSQPHQPRDATAPGDRRILMCEAEIQALRGHVCQMQVTLTRATRDLIQQNAALQQLQTHKKEPQDRFAGPVKSPKNAEPISIEEEVEIGIFQARVDGMEKERAEAGAVLKVLRKQREDTKSQLTHADTVIERQEHRIRSLEASVHRKGEQVEDFAVSIMKADNYARQQADLIEDLKRELSRSKCGPTRRRPTIDGSVRDAYVSRKLGKIVRSKDESPRRTPILRKVPNFVKGSFEHLNCKPSLRARNLQIPTGEPDSASTMGRRKVNPRVSGDEAQSAARHPSTTASVAMSVSPSPNPMPGPAPPPARLAEPLGETDASTMPAPRSALVTTRGQKRKVMALEPPGETTVDQWQRRRQNSDADYIATAPVPVQQSQMPGYYPGTQYGVSGPYPNQHSMSNSRQGSASHRAPSQSAGPYYPRPGSAMTQYGTTTGQANCSMTPNPISASRNPSIASTEFAPHYPLPPIRPSPTPSQMSTQMPPPAHTQPQHPSEMGQITMVPPAAVIRDLQAHVRKVEEVNAVRLRHLSDLASKLRQLDAANAGLRKELKRSTRVSGHAARLESLSSDEMLQLFIDSLQRDTRNLISDKEQLEMEIIRLNEELNKVVNGLPRDTAPIVRENLELKAKIQRSAWILASIEKQVARGMQPENSAGGPTGQ